MSQSTSIEELHSWLNNALPVDGCKDYGPNGLQVDAKAQVTHIASAATADQHSIDQAIAAGADVMLVHHGLFWGKAQPLSGMLGRRVASLFRHELALLAYHLPLDACPTWGNNAWILKQLGATLQEETFGKAGGLDLGLIGMLPEATDPDSLASALEQIFPDGIRWAPAATKTIQRIGVISGGGQNWHLEAERAGCDAFITGEAGEQNYHQAREGSCSFYAVGHSASERHAIHILAQHVADRFGLSHTRIAEDNPF